MHQRPRGRSDGRPSGSGRDQADQPGRRTEIPKEGGRGGEVPQTRDPAQGRPDPAPIPPPTTASGAAARHSGDNPASQRRPHRRRPRGQASTGRPLRRGRGGRAGGGRAEGAEGWSRHRVARAGRAAAKSSFRSYGSNDRNVTFLLCFMSFFTA
jgi:hypothetical protein